MDDGLDAPRAVLYSADPGDFVRLRTELAATARSNGDAALAKRVTGLRKPTTAASIVNRQVSADPSVGARLAAVGDALRAAQGGDDGIDRDRLRELSLERRTLVHEMVTAAIDAFGRTSGAAVRDEVSATFDAAVADPDVHAQLGRLTHAQAWSGFGVVADAPTLTVLPGGKPAERAPAGKPAERAPAGKPAKRAPAGTKDKPTAATTSKPAGSAKQQRELSRAEQKLSTTEHDLSGALGEEHDAKARADSLEKRITALQAELTAAEKDVKAARAAVRTARSRHREATSARNRAARRSET